MQLYVAKKSKNKKNKKNNMKSEYTKSGPLTMLDRYKW